MKLRLAAFLALALTSGAAHDLYLVTGIAGAQGKVCARVGEHFPDSMNAVTADRVDRFAVRGGADFKATAKVEGKQYCAPMTGVPAGPVEMVVTPRFIELKPEQFAEYIHGEGFTQVEKLRKERGETGKTGRELYSRYAKLLAGSDATAVLGHALEIVPHKDPATLAPGEALEVQVLFRGQPLADAQVAAVYSGFKPKGHEWPVVTRTDANGMATLKLDRPGLWYARMIHMVPSENDPDFQWRSFFATLTFTVPAKR